MILPADGRITPMCAFDAASCLSAPRLLSEPLPALTFGSAQVPARRRVPPAMWAPRQRDRLLMRSIYGFRAHVRTEALRAELCDAEVRVTGVAGVSPPASRACMVACPCVARRVVPGRPCGGRGAEGLHPLSSKKRERIHGGAVFQGSHVPYTHRSAQRRPSRLPVRSSGPVARHASSSASRAIHDVGRAPWARH